MNIIRWFMLVIVFSLCPIPVKGATWCQSTDSSGQTSTNKALLLFDHLAGKVLCPSPAVLEVREGDVFEIRFVNTDPRQFNYVIGGIADTNIEGTSFSSGTGSTTTDRLTDASVTWRHDRHFPLYKVGVNLRDGEAQADREEEAAEELGDAADQVELFSYSFPVWIRTIGWNITFTGGFAFSDLTSKSFFIHTSDNSTPENPDDDTKTIEVDPNENDDFRPDVVALVNLRVPENWKYVGDKLGVSFGIGMGDESEPRYYFGPSWTLGRGFILSGGWMGGRVSSLPVGQSIGQPPVNGDNTLGELGKRFAHGGFLGISFTFANREQEFISALAPAQRVADQRTEGAEEEDQE